MGYWKAKVVPAFQKLIGKDAAKKKAEAAEACKSFDESKGTLDKEFEEKKTELEPKVLGIYETCQIKALIKEPKVAGLKKHKDDVQKFIDELVKIEFPGAKQVSESTSKYGIAYVPGPVTYVFEKVSTYIPVEERPKEVEAPAAETTATTTEETATSTAEREIVVEETKEETAKEEVVAAEAAAAPAETAKAEEAAPPAAAKEEAPKA